MNPDGRPSLDNIIIVLSHTTEPGNIGAACRAMKTMGLRRLRLVNPIDPKGSIAQALAHGAQDILENAEVVSELPEAVADGLVIAGTTARRRQLRKHALLSPTALAERLLPHTTRGPVCLLFGTERTGLTNEEANICRYLSIIEMANPQPSLNLSQAVMVYCWEIRKAWLKTLVENRERTAKPGFARPEMYVRHPHRSTKLPSQFQLDMMYGHLAQAMSAIGYTEPEQRKFLTYLRQLHMRAGIVDWELQIYHLMARRILKATGQEVFDGRG
jgi:TrmH family RNA methyltransferase